jgi:hypothetical protein
MYSGEAQASKYINRANAWGGALSNIGNIGVMTGMAHQFPYGSTGYPWWRSPGME